MATVPGILPGLNLVANNQESAGGALAWLRDCLAAGDGPSTFEQLTDLAAGAEPGSGGVIFTPWLAGERSPIDNRAARAGFHNLSLRTTRADLVRAVLEGVAFNADGSPRPSSDSPAGGSAPIRAIGGGATSALWCSIYRRHARPAHRAGGRAGARQPPRQRPAGRSGAGRWCEPDELRSLVPVAATHHPQPCHTAVLRPPVRRVPRALLRPEGHVQAAQPEA